MLVAADRKFSVNTGDPGSFEKIPLPAHITELTVKVISSARHLVRSAYFINNF